MGALMEEEENVRTVVSFIAISFRMKINITIIMTLGLSTPETRYQQRVHCVRENAENVTPLPRHVIVCRVMKRSYLPEIWPFHPEDLVAKQQHAAAITTNPCNNNINTVLDDMH